MIDAGYSAKVPASDPSPYSGAASATSRAGQTDGAFYETLSNVGQNNQKSTASDSGAGNGASAGNADTAAADQSATDSADTAQSGPLIDIGQRPAKPVSDAALTGGTLWAKANEAADAADSAATAKDAAQAKDATKLMAAAETAEAQATRADLSRAVAEGKQGLASGKGSDAGKIDKTKNAETDAETEAGLSDADATALGDVLNLLSGDIAAVPGKGAPVATGEIHLDAKDQGMSARTEDELSALSTALDARSAEGAAADASLDAVASGKDADRDFRFVRADGKSMMMRTGADGAEDAATGADASARQATATIEVVDARRFLAPTASANAGNVLSDMVGDSEWASAMRPGSALANAASQTSTGNVVNTLKIKMHPIDLGSVTATLRLNGDTLTVELTVENSAAYRQLSDDQSDMVNALRAQGYAVDQIQVTMASVSRATSDGSQSQAAQQQTEQQMPQGGGQGGDTGSGRQDSAPGSAAGSSMTGVTVDEATAAQASGSGSGGARPDHVYI